MSALPRVLVLACFAALAALGPAQAQSLDTQIEAVRIKYGLPALAAAVVKDGRIVASGAAGVRVAGTSIAVTIDDRFHLGSDGKAMTSTLAGMLVDQGKLRWNSTLGEVLGADIPGMNPTLAAVTIEQLLSHSSGIPYDTKEMLGIYFNADAFDFNPATLRLRAIAAWRNNEPKVPAGSPFQYANFGYMTAGAMIEKAAGEPWERLMFKHIFEPLALRTAGLGPQATYGRYDAPVGHQVDDQGKVTAMPWGPAADGPPLLGPAGIAHMSVLDFAAWAGWNAAEGRRGPAIVKPETLKRIHRPHVVTPRIENPPPGTPQTGEYAMGWGVVKYDWTRGPVLSHNGSNGMNLAKIMVDVGNDLGIVVVTNFPGRKAEAAAAEALELLYRQFGPR